MTITRETLNDKTVAELRRICIDEKIVGMSKKRKDIIIDAILAKKGGKSVAPCTTTKSKGTSMGKPVGDPNNVSSATFEIESKLTSPHKQFGNRTTTTVRVSCGASSSNFPVTGKSVGAVKEFLREVLNIDKMADGLVNGERVDGTHILSEGDSLEFLKPAGRKG